MFSISQMRTKSKKCNSECKNAAMTIKTATGIKRFQDSQGYGKWFPTLFAVAKTRESCQPEQAIEPSPSPSPCSSLSQVARPPQVARPLMMIWRALRMKCLFL